MSSFFKLISVLTLSVAFTRATITIQTQNLIGNTTDTVHWTSSDLDSDPESFTMELNHPSFHHSIAIGNNVPTANMEITFQMPDVLPQGGYSLSFVENGNITNVFAMSAPFFVIENDITGPHTGLVSPTLPPPSPSTASSSASSTSNSTSVSSTSSSLSTSTPPTSSPPPPATTPVVVIPNPSASSGNSSIIGNSNNNGAGAIEIPLAATFLALVAWIF